MWEPGCAGRLVVTNRMMWSVADGGADATRKQSGNGGSEEHAKRAVKVWRTALAMWPGVSRPGNRGENEVSRVNTSHRTIAAGLVVFLKGAVDTQQGLQRGGSRTPTETETEGFARRHGRTWATQKKNVPFCGTRIGKLELTNGIIRWVGFKRPVKRVIGILEI